MFTILYAIILTWGQPYAHYSYGYAITSQQIGKYKTLEQCQAIANQLKEPGSDVRRVTVRCVQIE